MAMTASSRAPQGAGQSGERTLAIRAADRAAGPVSAGQAIDNAVIGRAAASGAGFVGPVLAKHIADFGRYPIAKGIEPFRRAAANWLSSRFDLPRGIDPETELLVLNGSREGLFFAAITAARYVGERKGRPAILMPNPFYPAYGAGARAAGCEPIYLPTTLANGFLPDLDALDDATLAGPWRSTSPRRRIRRARWPHGIFRPLKKLADRFGFMILSDECYSEIYTQQAPGSMLECAGPDFANVVAFQSLSKRSNLPGMRVGFAAGDSKFLGAYHELRNVAAPQVPVPLQHVAVAAYSDECMSRKTAALPSQIRSRRSDPRQSLWLSSPGRRLLRLARCVGPWRRRSGDGEAVQGRRRARGARKLPGAAATRRQQSRRRLHSSGAGTGP
jgi:N-succinyldiaminopimelate aminotransferase